MNSPLTCRTCLESKDAAVYVNVKENCHLDYSVKNIITMLVPQMAATLLDTDFICENCFNILENCIMFIEKCLNTEEKLKISSEIFELNYANNLEVISALSNEESSMEVINSPRLELEDYHGTNDNSQENCAEKAQNYVEKGMYVDTMLPDKIVDHNRIITLEQADSMIKQGFIKTLAQNGGINILQVCNSLDMTTSSTKKRILLLGSHIFNTAYKCPKCPKCLQSQKQYNDHVFNCNKKPASREDEELIKCLICKRKIKNKHMELHLTRHEQKQTFGLAEERKENRRLLQCRSCFERFTSKQDYELHLEIHPPYICDKCGKTFAHSTSLTAHSNTHNNPNTCICEICGKGYKDKCMLRVHLQTHENKKYTCDMCSKDFKSRNRIIHHIKNVHSSRFTKQCSECGKLFKSISCLNSHYRLVHLKMLPYKCQICNKDFGRSDYLRRHMATHSAEIDIVTNKPKRRRLSLKSYIDDNPQRLPCKFCGKQLLGVIKLKMHLQTHLRRFPCQFCPLTFARKQFCKRHELAHKGWENYWRCNICWIRLVSKEDLDAHVEAKHQNPKYSCDACGKKFHREYLLNHHSLKEHSNLEDPEEAREIVYDSVLEIIRPT